MTKAAGLPAHLAHPFSPAGRVDPYPAYAWLQARDPVHRDPVTGMWLVTGHADCAALLKDPKFSAASGQRERSREDDLPVSMLTTDGFDHTRLRAPGALLLGPAALASVADAIAADADALLDRAVERGTPVDAVEELGAPLATAVLARLFGLSEDGQETLAALARAASVNLDPLAPPHIARLGRAAMGELTRFLDAHTDRADPHCPLGRLAADTRLTRQEMLGVLGLAVVGGWQPLAEAVGNALYWLLPRPGCAPPCASPARTRPRPPSTSCCASKRRSPSPPASPSTTPNFPAGASRPGSGSSRCSPPPTGTPPSSPTPTAWCGTGGPTRTSPSAAARTSAWPPAWSSSPARCCSPGSSAASPRPSSPARTRAGRRP